jgi:hypothetical protein
MTHNLIANLTVIHPWRYTVRYWLYTLCARILWVIIWLEVWKGVGSPNIALDDPNGVFEKMRDSNDFSRAPLCWVLYRYYVYSLQSQNDNCLNHSQHICFLLSDLSIAPPCGTVEQLTVVQPQNNLIADRCAECWVLSHSQYILSESGTDISVTGMLQKKTVTIVPLCGRAEETRNEQDPTSFHFALGTRLWRMMTHVIE